MVDDITPAVKHAARCLPHSHLGISWSLQRIQHNVTTHEVGRLLSVIKWTIDISPFRGKAVRIVAIDGSTQANSWLGFGWPTQVSRPTILMNRFLDNLEYLAALVGAVLWGAIWPYPDQR
jgi:hypothetical protein